MTLTTKKKYLSYGIERGELMCMMKYSIGFFEVFMSAYNLIGLQSMAKMYNYSINIKQLDSGDYLVSGAPNDMLFAICEN
jgi:hypothetical protein